MSLSPLPSIKEALRNAFAPHYLEVVDQSHLHKGHQEAESGKLTHIQITIESALLKDLSPLTQHRQIYACLSQAGFDLHAISIKVIK